MQIASEILHGDGNDKINMTPTWHTVEEIKLVEHSFNRENNITAIPSQHGRVPELLWFVVRDVVLRNVP